MIKNQKTDSTNSTQRLEAFSDCIFAIVMTLLFLELKVPEVSKSSDWRELLQVIYQLSPKFVSIVLSFVFTAVFWVAHHQFFRTLQETTRGLLFLNLVFLFLVCLVPFPAAIMTEHPHNETAVVFFGTTILLTSVMLYALRRYAWVNHPEISSATSGINIKQALNRSLLMVGFYTATLAVSFFFPAAAIVMYLLTLLILLFPIKIEVEEAAEGDQNNITAEVVL